MIGGVPGQMCELLAVVPELFRCEGVCQNIVVSVGFSGGVTPVGRNISSPSSPT